MHHAVNVLVEYGLHGVAWWARFVVHKRASAFALALAVTIVAVACSATVMQHGAAEITR